jgi:hypothetical protein
MTTELTKELELETCKWALEMSLEYGQKLFPQKRIKKPSEIINNAKRIVELVKSSLNENINDEGWFDERDRKLLEKNP